MVRKTQQWQCEAKVPHVMAEQEAESTQDQGSGFNLKGLHVPVRTFLLIVEYFPKQYHKLENRSSKKEPGGGTSESGHDANPYTSPSVDNPKPIT